METTRTEACGSDLLGSTTALLQRVRAQFVQRLEEYEAIRAAEERRKSDQADAVFDNLALDLGMKTLKARVEWCDEAIERLTRLGARGPSGA